MSETQWLRLKDIEWEETKKIIHCCFCGDENANSWYYEQDGLKTRFIYLGNFCLQCYPEHRDMIIKKHYAVLPGELKMKKKQLKKVNLNS